MGGRDRGRRLKGKDKRWQGYGTSSTAAMEEVQKRGEEMEDRLHLPVGLKGVFKRTKGKAPLMHQVVTVK